MKYVICVIVLLLSGCGYITIKSEITRYHKLYNELDEKKYTFLPLEDQRNDLQYETYKNYIRILLKNHNFTEVSKEDVYDYVVFFVYDDEMIENTFARPVYGQTGIASSTTHGTINTHGNQSTINLNTTYIPAYGIVGEREMKEDIHKQYLSFFIAEPAPDANNDLPLVYEAHIKASNKGQTRTDLMQTMLIDLFGEFPGNSGETKIYRSLPQIIEQN